MTGGEGALGRRRRPGRPGTVRGDSRAPAPAPSVLAAAGHPKRISGVPEAGLGAAALIIPYGEREERGEACLGKDFY